MNFQEFIDKGKLDKFRKVRIDLTEKKSGTDGLIEEIAESFQLSELLELRKLLNDKLEKEYRGKLRIDYCLPEDYINSIVKDRLKSQFCKHLNEANDKVAKAKTKIERKISSMLTDAPSSR